MKLDPIAFLVGRIKATPDLPANVTVSGDLDMHSPGSRQIDVELEGGRRIIRDRLDAWTFQISHYAPLKAQAMGSALLVREYLLEQVPGHAYEGVGVDEIEEEQGPTDVGDIDSKEQRFIHRVTIYIYEA